MNLSKPSVTWGAVAALVCAVACAAPRSTAPPPKEPAAVAPKAPPAFRVVMIERAWVDKQLSVERDDARAWAERPENAAKLRPVFRHILVRVHDEAPSSDAQAKKKIDAALARLQKGADFGAVAAELSEDPGSAKNGGSYPGETVAGFVAPVRDAYERLSPGQTSPEPVRSAFGWHIVRKDAPTDEAKVGAFRRTLAATKTVELASDVLARLRSGEAPAQKSVDAAIARVLGARAAADGARPKAEWVAAETPRASLSNRCARVLDMGPDGEVTDVPDEGALVSVKVAATEGQVPVEPGATCAKTSPPELADLLKRLTNAQAAAAEAAPPEPVDTSSYVSTPPRAARLFEIFRVDDGVDPLRAVSPAALPATMSIRFEVAPLPDRRTVVHFVASEAAANEKLDAALARARRWSASALHPPGTFFAFEEILSDARAAAGYRSHLLREPVIVDDRDVVAARVQLRDPEWPAVSFELGPDGARRFERATREWTDRRIAILVDGVVAIAPIVKSATGGGRGEFVVNGDTPESRKRTAERIARALTKR